jgi:hypothetical protein
VRCAVCGVRCAVCGVRCAVCGVRCAVCGASFAVLWAAAPLCHVCRRRRAYAALDVGSPASDRSSTLSPAVLDADAVVDTGQADATGAPATPQRPLAVDGTGRPGTPDAADGSGSMGASARSPATGSTGQGEGDESEVALEMVPLTGRAGGRARSDKAGDTAGRRKARRERRVGGRERVPSVDEEAAAEEAGDDGTRDGEGLHLDLGEEAPALPSAAGATKVGGGSGGAAPATPSSAAAGTPTDRPRATFCQLLQDRKVMVCDCLGVGWPTAC